MGTKAEVVYTETTENVMVSVWPAYVPEKSSPEKKYYFFAYKVKIKNNNTVTVQLLNRHWVITDGAGKIEEVRGPGVVGEQPVINPGEDYEYVSACPLTTPTGNMRGRYTLIDINGKKFEVNIPLFFLRTEVFH